jgi:hypothetical protein
MSQKSSLTQPAQAVSGALTADTQAKPEQTVTVVHDLG